MTALEKIFEGYINKRMDGDNPDPERMDIALLEVERELEHQGVEGMMAVLELVSAFGNEAERTGFFAGFRMAWELLNDMQMRDMQEVQK
ncbi:MAG: hypothetical protein Q4B26_11985 [Eubacteriales bacterium]|nr:hypothetical protein [Eubacteriales bacterium]